MTEFDYCPLARRFPVFCYILEAFSFSDGVVENGVPRLYYYVILPGILFALTGSQVGRVTRFRYYARSYDELYADFALYYNTHCAISEGLYCPYEALFIINACRETRS